MLGSENRATVEVKTLAQSLLVRSVYVPPALLSRPVAGGGAARTLASPA